MTIVRTYPDRPILAVGAIVVRDGAVLLARRGKAPSYGLWSLPGGAVDLGERIKDAVCREIAEECGIRIEVTDVVEVFERLVRDADGRVQYHYVILDYLARWQDGEPGASDEVLESRWVAPADFPQYEMTKGTAEVILRMLETGRRAGVI
ncbi:MAG: NUDIX hydrolase [Candidatus Methylomirabilales bacterium]